MWYALNRLGGTIVVLAAIMALTFFIFFVLAPIDPAVLLAGKQPTPQLVAQVRANLGLDRPVPLQFLQFVRNTTLGDQYGWPGLGYSYVTHTPIIDEMGRRLPITLSLGGGAALLWLALGLSIGVVSGVKKGTWLDRTVMTGSLFFVSAPVFWLGLVLLWVFWYKLQIVPGTGYFALGEFGVVAWVGHLVLPCVSLALLFAAWYARMIRGSLLDVLDEPYIETAVAKGVSRMAIVGRHALRPAVLPVITMVGMDLGALLGSAAVVEQVFNLQGVGQWAVQSVFAGDIPVVLAVTLLAALFVAVGNLLVDFSYPIVDPRLRK
jgi:peptide/nickel transport system permease protein